MPNVINTVETPISRQYVGARYVPIFDGAWDNTKDYAPLTVVSYEGNSYTSRTYVPSGTAITNETYWALSGNYNAQVESYRQEVAELSENASLKQGTNITVNIPTDYNTLEDAINNLSGFTCLPNITITLNIESGHKLTKGLKLIGQDYSQFIITSEDETVKLSDSFAGYDASTTDYGETTDGTPNTFMVGINTQMPVLDTVIDMENRYGDGIALYCSKMFIKRECGVINGGRFGIYIKDSSNVEATGTIWDGSNSAGLRMQHTSNGTFNASSFKNCCKTDATLGSVYVSKQCLCQVRESEISGNTLSYGILARRSRVDCEQTEITNCYGGIRAEGGSFISAAACVVDGATTEDSIMCISSIIVGGRCSNSAHLDFYVRDGGIILFAEKSSSEADGVSLADCRNTTAFNVMNKYGMVNAKNTESTYRVSTVTDGIKIEYPSHTEEFLRFWINQEILADGSAIMDLTSKVSVPSGKSLKSFEVTGMCRVNTGGGGVRLASVISGIGPQAVTVHNYGIPESGADTTAQSVFFNVHLVYV